MGGTRSKRTNLENGKHPGSRTKRGTGRGKARGTLHGGKRNKNRQPGESAGRNRWERGEKTMLCFGYGARGVRV